MNYMNLTKIFKMNDYQKFILIIFAPIVFIVDLALYGNIGKIGSASVPTTTPDGLIYRDYWEVTYVTVNDFYMGVFITFIALLCLYIMAGMYEYEKDEKNI